MSTKVGYVLPSEESTNCVPSNLISSHVIKLQSSILSANENLHSTMKKFWASETLRTELLENNVLKKFNNKVDFTENRYQVKDTMKAYFC